MIIHRPSHARGHANHGWLDSYHTFSFADYYDPKHMHFRALRVMNEDVVAPAHGFDTHPHDNMEIVTYILEGELEHRDSMGNREVLRKGEFQRMTAGTGITHSERNPSSSAPVHLYQIWLIPEKRGLEPSYEQKAFPPHDRINRFQLVASPDGAEGSLYIHQDVRIYLAILEGDQEISLELPPNRHAWIQVLKGNNLTINSIKLTQGDGAAVSDEPLVTLKGSTGAEIMVFDLG
jgi:redox-sensitive bicupin YhaK (pirin superfamily)